MDVILISYNSRLFTTTEHKLYTTYRELIEIVYSMTIYEHIIIGSDDCINVLNDDKSDFRCFTKIKIISPILYTAEMQLTNFQKLRVIQTQGKIFL